MAKKIVNAESNEVFWAILKAFYAMGGLFRAVPGIILSWIASRMRSGSGIIIEDKELAELLEEYIKQKFITKVEEDGQVEYRFHRGILKGVFTISNPVKKWPDTDEGWDELFSQAECPIESKSDDQNV